MKSPDKHVCWDIAKLIFVKIFLDFFFNIKINVFQDYTYFLKNILINIQYSFININIRLCYKYVESNNFIKINCSSFYCPISFTVIHL